MNNFELRAISRDRNSFEFLAVPHPPENVEDEYLCDIRLAVFFATRFIIVKVDFENFDSCWLVNCVKGLFDIFTTIEVEMQVLLLNIELQQPIMGLCVTGNFENMPNVMK